MFTLIEENLSLVASLPFCFWFSINLSKPFSSIVKPFSLAMIFVKSTGKPKVSYSLKTSPPFMIGILLKCDLVCFSSHCDNQISSIGFGTSFFLTLIL